MRVAMAGPLLVYGATGYTGKLIVKAAIEARLPIVLSGRNEAKLNALASEFGLEFRTAAVDDPSSLARALAGTVAVLNAAGPFRVTSPPLVEASLRAGVHYLDVTGEALVIDAASGSHDEARRRGVMVMPAVGFDVVPSDCLVLHVAQRAIAPRLLRIGLSGLDLLTRGSAKTIIAQIGDPVWVRRAGVLTRVPPGALQHAFDYGKGPAPSLAVTWGDVVTAFLSTGIRDITVYSEGTPAVKMHHALVQSFGWAIPMVPWREMLAASTEWMPEGPTEEQRLQRKTVIVVEAEDAEGRVTASRISTPDAYSTTASAAVAIMARVLAGHFEPGFQTPARVYGPDLPLQLAGVQREDIV